MWQINKDTVVTWYYSDGDEFKTNKLNIDKWSYSYGWARTIYANKEQQYYTEGRNHILNGNTLSLTAKKENIVARTIDQYSDSDTIKNNGKFYSLNKTSFDYSAGMIQSKTKYNKGYFECRVKLPKQEGYWPAFWLYGGSPNEEIDMLEGKTERKNQIHIDTHCPNKCDLVNLFLQKKSYGGWVKTEYKFTEEFNIIACDWDDEKIKFYLNGECIGIVKVKFDAEKHIVFNIAVPSDNGPFHPGPDIKDTTTAFFEIDYVRVWNNGITENQNGKKTNNLIIETNVENSKPILTERKSKTKGKLTYGKKIEHKNEDVFISCFENENNLQIYSLGIFDENKPTYTISDNTKKYFSGTIDKQIFDINKASLANGEYNLNITVNGKSVVKKFYVN